MARNGSGTYSLPAGNPVTTGTTISSSWANNTLTDIGNTLTASLASDGQTVPVANLPMGAYNHTNVGVATNRTNYAQAGQVQDGTYSLLTSVSGTDTITATGAISVSAYATGQTFHFVAVGANTTTGVTLNINGIGAKSITKAGATALSIGDIFSGEVVTVVYDGTQFQLQTNILGVTSFSAGTTGLTPATGTKGSVTLAGTLATTNGGTNLTSFTSGGAMYATSTSALTTGTLPVASGGTGATTASAALTNLLTPTTAGNVIFTTDGSTWSSTSKITLSTTQATTSGTSKDFTSIPSWVKRITVMFNGVSVSGTSDMLIQAGTSSGVVSTGYSATAGRLGGGGTANLAFTTGFPCVYNPTASYTYTGTIVITNITGNTWIGLATTVPSSTSGQITIGSGSIALGATLDRVRLTTVNGTDTFDAGSVNILYE